MEAAEISSKSVSCCEQMLSLYLQGPKLIYMRNRLKIKESDIAEAKSHKCAAQKHRDNKQGSATQMSKK